MRMKLYTLLCISFFLLFTACNQDDDPVPPEVGSRTVLVYIVADNNLSSFAKEDVEEMIAAWNPLICHPVTCWYIRMTG